MSEGARIRGRNWTSALAAVVLVGLAALPAAAQVSTGVIEVYAIDGTGAVLPGVSVRAVNADTGLQRVTVTGGDGSAQLPALPAGTYTVTASLDGFSTIREENVVLLVGQTVRLRLTMRVEVAETIEVTAEAPLVDMYRSDTSTNITPEQIQELPVPSREFEKLAFIAPGVQRERGSFRFITGGPVIGSGGNASQSTIMVDGVDFTDQALGLARTRFSQDAIREFRVVTNRFDTEIGNSAGGALSIVTRSGSNEIAGSAFGFYRGDSLRATGALEQDDLDYSRYQVGFTLGGPVVRDRTHYFLSLEYVDEDDITLFRPGGAYTGLAADVDLPSSQLLGLASFNHQFSYSANLDAKLVYEQFRLDNFRVGGVCDVDCGQELNRDNWNLALGHTWVVSDDRLNELRFQAGTRKYEEPANSREVGRWFSSGSSLQTGMNILGDLLGEGDYYELRDTYHMYLSAGAGSHDLKFGGAIQYIDERSRIDLYQAGLFLYATDDPMLPPLAYAYGTGSSDITIDTTLYSAFVQDDWRPNPDLTLSFGLRYDYDTDGNNPDFTHPNTGPRSADDDNFQPRFGFTWDASGKGSTVVRGGVGLFTGRYLLVPAFTELQQNGVTGRILTTRLNGFWLGLPPAFWLDPASPTTTGVPLPPDSTLLQDNLEAPEAIQASLGVSQRLGDTGLVIDIEGVYADGDNEIVVRDVNWGGNANPVRPNPSWNQINMYTNEGHSEYMALIASVNGTIRGGHLISASVTVADKQNISDDFSPEFPFGYPSDPADIEAEYGTARGTEDYRIVLSGIFRLPWDITIAPIWEYGSGQPWNHRLGYDFNGDGKNSDRPEGVKRNSMDGPRFTQLSLRLTKTIRFAEQGELDVILEGFNVFDTTNYDVSSIDQAEFLSGPTLSNPTAPYVENLNFGKPRATLEPREIQVGLRYRF